MKGVKVRKRCVITLPDNKNHILEKTKKLRPFSVFCHKAVTDNATRVAPITIHSSFINRITGTDLTLIFSA